VSASPRSVVERYNLEFWNQRRFELADEIIGDELVRNELGGRVTLTRAEARKRAEDLWAGVEHVEFTLLQTVGDGDLVSIVYQADITRRDGTSDAIASIEVFRVVDGKIVEVWNNAHQHGRWPDGAAAS
jgi:hypothetical protein